MDSGRPPLLERCRQGFFAWLNRRIRQVEAWARRTELRKGTRVELHGVAFVLERGDAAAYRVCREKVQAALELVARHDPRSLEAMRGHFSGILVWNGVHAANGSYLHPERLCMLNSRYVRAEGTEPARIAMTLIHELTHAKHFSRGRPLAGVHAEWLCIGAELAFIRKVPGTEHLRRGAARRLERRPDFYSREAETQRGIADLEARGARWSVAFLRFLQRRRARAGT